MAWVAQRSLARRAVVLALAAVIGVTAFLLAGIAGFGARVGTVGLRDFVRTADADAASLQIQSRLSGPASAPGSELTRQFDAARSLFAGLFAALPVTVQRSVTLPPVPVTATSATPDAPPDGKPTVRLAWFADLPAHAHVIAGAWPDLQPGSFTGGGSPTSPERQPAALQDTAAQALHLSVGDTLSIGNTDRVTFEIAAIWAPDRPGEAYFSADAAAARGDSVLAADRAAAGFVAVAPPVLAAKGTTALLNWTIVPDAERVVPADVPAMSAAIDAVPDAVTADRAMAPQGAVSAGRLAQTLRTLGASITAAQAVAPVPSLLVGAISLLMLVQLARLLTAQRRSETALIRSRGASAGQLGRIALIEAALISVPAAAIGVGAAAGVLSATDATVPPTGWVQAAIAAAVAVVVIAAPAVHQARRGADRQLVDDSGRLRSLAGASTVLLVLIAAAVSLWRFLRAGSALVVAQDGSAYLDPIAVLAPALALIAAAVLAAVVFGGLAGVAETVTARFRSLGASLAARQIARRGTVFGVVVVMVAIAIGGVGIAASYSATQSAVQTSSDVLRNGAPLLVRLPAVDPMTAQAYRTPLAAVAAARPAVGDTLPVLHEPITVGGLAATLIGVPAHQASGVVPDAGTSFRPDLLAAALTGEPGSSGSADPSPPPGVALPDGATAVTLHASAGAGWLVPGVVTAHSDGPNTQAPSTPGPSGASVSLGLTVWLQGPDGTLTPVDTPGFDSVPVAPTPPGTAVDAEISVPLPDLADGTRLVALDLVTASAPYPMQLDMSVRSAEARTPSGTVPLDLRPGTWTGGPAPIAANGEIGQLVEYKTTAAANGMGLTGTVPAGQGAAARLTLAGPADLPVAVDAAVASALQIQPGARLTLALDAARQFPARVAVVSPVLPGDTDTFTMLADLSALQLMLLRTTPDLPAVNELWAAPTDTAAAAAALRPLIPATSIVTAADTRSAQALIAPTALTLWFGAAGALLLAAIGVGSVIAGLARSRRGELVVLRSVGVTARAQARGRRRELLVTVVIGWILGVAVAATVVLATVTHLAGSAVVGSLGTTPTLRVAWATAGVAIGAHMLLVLTIVGLHSVRLRRQVLVATPSELVM